MSVDAVFCFLVPAGSGLIDACSWRKTPKGILDWTTAPHDLIKSATVQNVVSTAAGFPLQMIDGGDASFLGTL